MDCQSSGAWESDDIMGFSLLSIQCLQGEVHSLCMLRIEGRRDWQSRQTTQRSTHGSKFTLKLLTTEPYWRIMTGKGGLKYSHITIGAIWSKDLMLKFSFSLKILKITIWFYWSYWPLKILILLKPCVCLLHYLSLLTFLPCQKKNLQ